MTSKVYKAGLIGCGDYLRWEIDTMNACKKFKVKSTFDLIAEKAKKRADQLGAQAVDSDDTIFNDPEIDVVLIYTPPWVRIPLFEKAVKNNKHIITTKPLASNLDEAKKLCDLVNSNVSCAVFYRRTGNAGVEQLKQIFDSGEIGKLTIYKEDWFHHYPQWNDWATDPEKNGGPFMDAMVHNLNLSRYLIGSEVRSYCYFSDNHAQTLKCNDTEFLKVNFENGASSHLFITWAADLEVYSLDGNEREHYGICHMITDKGWYVKEDREDDKHFILAKKEKEVKKWPVEPLPNTAYDDFVISKENGKTQNHDISFAMEDMKIIDRAMKNPTKMMNL